MGTPQLTLDLPTALSQDAYRYGERSSGDTHGVVLTKPHVVRLILDLAGYVTEQDLAAVSLLEPACGHGVFLVEAVHRLMASAKRTGRCASELTNAFLAYDVDPDHITIARQAVVDALTQHEVTEADAQKLASRWLVCGDYLLAHSTRTFDYIVGNPPYIRIEQISTQLQSEYRRRYESLYDRADLYVAFIEKSLRLLNDNGKLSFICADRWIVNRYGAALRRIVTEQYRLRYYIDLHRASPFDTEVIAYPSIFVIGRGATGKVHVASLETASAGECEAVLPAVEAPSGALPGVRAFVYDRWFQGEEPWVVSTPKNLGFLRELEDRYELIETGGTRIGIGVATGNDRVFIVDDTADIEADRLVPLVMRDDLKSGLIRNAHRSVINTFGADGKAINLDDYPRLAAYFNFHADDIRRRHVAQKNASRWFRTIDRVYPELVRKPKLLIPDIAGSNEVVFDEGHYHPHHNLYFVTSPNWDMAVLGGLLSSRVALFFVWSYAVKMRGGYLRFQAQYLRRIRLPSPASLSPSLSTAIADAFLKRDFAQLDQLALDAYRIPHLPDFDFVDTRR